jgi:alkylation response protein AidB-like acyl-CoA dehydrogenase
VREFLGAEIAAGTFEPRCDAWLSGHDPAFSRTLASHGWVGMTLPRAYGGTERTAVERFVVVEELLAHGAPVAAHWIADRQTGPLLLKYGSEAQRQRFLPAIAAGACYFAIGMSEPDAGSDLASIRTSATKVDSGWRLNGQKVWTSHAHRSHFSIVLCRTSPRGDRPHEGLSQVVVDLEAPGVTIRPIATMTGDAHFCEMHFDDVLVPDEMLVGEAGQGWAQVLSELAFERSGPERYLSTYPLFAALVDELGPQPDVRGAEVIGRLAAHASALHQMSLRVAERIDAGEAPAREAATAKELGTRFEREVAEAARSVVEFESASPRFKALYAGAILHGPGFTLRGGTNEILRGIIARGLVAP